MPRTARSANVAGIYWLQGRLREPHQFGGIKDHFSFYISELRQKTSWAIMAYALSESSYSLLVRLHDGNLSQGMRYFQAQLSRELRQNAATQGTCYAGRFLSRFESYSEEAARAQLDAYFENPWIVAKCVGECLIAPVAWRAEGKDKNSAATAVKQMEEQQLLEVLLAELGLTRQQLGVIAKNHPGKQLAAAYLASHRLLAHDWIALQLCMGHATAVSRALKAIRCPDGPLCMKYLAMEIALQSENL